MSKPSEPKQPPPVKAVSPFVAVETACPLCGAVSIQRKVKPHYFLEQDLDLDLRPRKIVRKRSGLEAYDPLLYFIWRCPQCFFAASRSRYGDPGQGTGLSGEEIARGLKNKLESAPGLAKLVAVLARDADPEIRNRFDALRLTLAAIIQLQSAVESAVQATPALARYYLRLAWLYHEMDSLPPDQEELKTKTSGLTGQLKKVWGTIPENENAALKLAIGLYELSLSESRMIEDELDSVKVYLLVARLRAKLGDLARAMNSWNKGRDVARKFEMRRKKESPNSQDLLLKSENMKNAVKEVADLLTGLSGASDPGQGDEDRAREIIDGYFGTDKKELRRFLSDEGIGQEIIDRLIPPKKGGLRGLFKKA